MWPKDIITCCVLYSESQNDLKRQMSGLQISPYVLSSDYGLAENTQAFSKPVYLSKP
jgi:hypothetical protein